MAAKRAMPTRAYVLLEPHFESREPIDTEDDGTPRSLIIRASMNHFAIPGEPGHAVLRRVLFSVDAWHRFFDDLDRIERHSPSALTSSGCGFGGSWTKGNLISILSQVATAKGKRGLVSRGRVRAGLEADIELWRAELFPEVSGHSNLFGARLDRRSRQIALLVYQGVNGSTEAYSFLRELIVQVATDLRCEPSLVERISNRQADTPKKPVNPKKTEERFATVLSISAALKEVVDDRLGARSFRYIFKRPGHQTFTGEDVAQLWTAFDRLSLPFEKKAELLKTWHRESAGSLRWLIRQVATHFYQKAQGTRT